MRVTVQRSAWAPPKTLVTLSNAETGEKTVVLPPETSDETLAVAKRMADAHNEFDAAMETIHDMAAKPLEGLQALVQALDALAVFEEGE